MGAEPPVPLATATAWAPLMLPGAVQPVVDCAGRALVAWWGLWQSAQTA